MSRLLSSLALVSFTSTLSTTSTAFARRPVVAPGATQPSSSGFAKPPPPVSVNHTDDGLTGSLPGDAGGAADAPMAAATGAPMAAAAGAPMPVDADAPHLTIAPPVIPTRAEVRAALAKVRAQNLASFRAYYLARIYPSNTYSKQTLNVWRDEAEHFCAAATIMVKSGNEALAIQIADDNNFIKLGDVKQGPVMDWILTSGFTQAELALIQRPFMPVTKRPVPAPTEEDAGVHVAQIDPALRKAETVRLLAKYKQIDKQLVAKQKRSLDAAVDRLMKRPTLAATVVAAARA